MLSAIITVNNVALALRLDGHTVFDSQKGSLYITLSSYKPADYDTEFNLFVANADIPLSLTTPFDVSNPLIDGNFKVFNQDSDGMLQNNTVGQWLNASRAQLSAVGDLTPPGSVPEPSTLALMLAGGCVLLGLRRKARFQS